MLSQNHPFSLPTTARPLVTDIAGIPTQFPSPSLPLWFCCHQRSVTGDDCFGWEGGKRGRRWRPTCTSFTSPTVTAVRDSNIFFAGLLKKIVLFHSSWILCFLVSQVNASLLGIQAQKRGRAPFFFLGKRGGGRPHYSERISGEKSFWTEWELKSFVGAANSEYPRKEVAKERMKGYVNITSSVLGTSRFSDLGRSTAHNRKSLSLAINFHLFPFFSPKRFMRECESHEREA